MAGRVIRIERVAPRKGVVEAPVRTEKGYQLADPAHGADKHKVAHAVYVETLEEAASLIARGFSLRMGPRENRRRSSHGTACGSCARKRLRPADPCTRAGDRAPSAACLACAA